MRQQSRCSGWRIAPAAALAALLGCLFLSGCATTEGTVGLTAAGATAFFGGSPNNELEQIYYFGVFDEREQLPPMFYRVRVRGQASGLSGVKFASGWVKAGLIDSLGTSVSMDMASGNATLAKTEQPVFGDDEADRALILFGPERFRRAPKDHRLVIVMGSSPESYFSAMDQVLGQMSQATAEKVSQDMERELFKALVQLAAEKESLAALDKDVALELKEGE